MPAKSQLDGSRYRVSGMRDKARALQQRAKYNELWRDYLVKTSRHISDMGYFR
jgi:hypothetical protein